MKLVPLHSLFEINYGNSFDLTLLEECSEEFSEKVNYVSRTRENNGVSAFVKKLDNVEPFEKDLITVAGSGNSVLESFIQPLPFYTGYHVFVLKPIKEMTELEKLFYCYCIRQNQYKYNYGRQANRTLKDLLIPLEVTEKFKDIDIQQFVTLNKNRINNYQLELNTPSWSWFELSSLFDISASRDDLIENLTLNGETPYIASTEFNNGIIGYVDEQPTNKAGTITANRGGSVGYFFYQPKDYLATPVDVRILTPKFLINEYIGLFITTILKLEKYRFNYSRKMGTDRLKNLRIKLPSKDKQPDFEFMENYIKSLSYSSSL